MFALIETKGATHIAIYVPQDSAAQSLPQLARMLEENATFINVGRHSLNVVTPEMSIILGDKYKVKDTDDIELIVAKSGEVIDEGFTIATPEVFTSNRNALNKKRRVKFQTAEGVGIQEL